MDKVKSLSCLTIETSRKQRGFSTLELFVSLAISLPVLLMTAQLLHRSTMMNIKLKTEAAINSRALRLRSIMEDVMSDLDSHRLPVPVRVHSGAQINYADGQPNPIMQHAELAPVADSDAVTALRVDFQNILRVRSATYQTSGTRFEACHQPGVSLDQDLIKNYLAVSADGMFELGGESVPMPGDPLCRYLILEPQVSMSLQTPATVRPENVRLLIPITKHYTIYIDRTGQLRLLGHRGAENIENQPLTGPYRGLSMHLQLTNERFSFLKASLNSAKPRPLTISVHNQLARLPLMNILLNAP